MASKNQRQHFLLVAVVVAGAVLAFCTLCSSAKGSLYSTCLSISVRSTFSVFLSLFFRSHSLTLPLYRYLFSFASCAFVCAIANISTNDKYVLKCERKIGYRSDMPLHFFSFRSSFHVIVCVWARLRHKTKSNRKAFYYLALQFVFSLLFFGCALALRVIESFSRALSALYVCPCVYLFLFPRTMFLSATAFCYCSFRFCLFILVRNSH